MSDAPRSSHQSSDADRDPPPKDVESASKPEPEPVQWRWAVLFAFCANSFSNSYAFMDFNTVPSVTKQLFGYCENEQQVTEGT